MISVFNFFQGKKRKLHPCTHPEEELSDSTDGTEEECQLDEEVQSADEDQELYKPDRDMQMDSDSDMDSEHETEKYVKLL